MLVIGLFVSLRVRHCRVETTECFFFARYLQFLAVEDSFYFPVQRVVLFCQHASLGLGDIMTVSVIFADFGKRCLDIRLQPCNGIQTLLIRCFGPDWNHHPEDDGNNEQYDQGIQH